MSVWHLYVVRTREGTLYTGIATDVERRIAEHEGDGGRGAKYLSGRGPLTIVFRCEIGAHEQALRIERRFKQLRRADKQSLIDSGPDQRRLLELLGVTT